MVQGINGEFRLFLISILAGAILFLVYDIGKAFRKAIRHKTGWVALEDLLYWIFAAFFLFYIFLHIYQTTLFLLLFYDVYFLSAAYWNYNGIYQLFPYNLS